MSHVGDSVRETEEGAYSINRYTLYALIAATVFGWMFFIVTHIPDSWGDSYAYLNDLKSAIHSGYGAFSFGFREHPLYTLLLYCLGKMSGSAYFAAKLASMACFSLTLFYVFRIATLKDSVRSGLIALVVCSTVFLDYATVSLAVLSEPFFIAVLLAAVYYQFAGRRVLSSVLFGILPFIRNEFVIVLPVITMLYLLERRWREVKILLLITIPSGIVWYVVFFSRLAGEIKGMTTTLVKGLSGDRNTSEIFLTPFVRFSELLFGGSTVVLLLALVLLVCALGVFVAKTLRERLSLEDVLSRYSHVVFVSLFLCGCFFPLVMLYYLGYHPLSMRHFAFLAPFAALLIAWSIAYLAKTLQGSTAGSYRMDVVTVVSLAMLLGAVYLPGRFVILSRTMDGIIPVGRWLEGKLAPGEKLICPDPGILYYSGYGRRDTVAYPADIKNIKEYKRLNVKYVAWSELWCFGNLEARTALRGLENGSDYLFFRKAYSPQIKEGWFGAVFSIDESLLNEFFASIDDGWHPQEAWGRWANGSTSTITYYAPVKQLITLTFNAGAYVEPAILKIYSGEKIVKEVAVGIKDGMEITPTKVSVTFSAEPGSGVIKLVGPDKFFVPRETGEWDSPLKLRLAYSSMTIQGLQLF